MWIRKLLSRRGRYVIACMSRGCGLGYEVRSWKLRRIKGLKSSPGDRDGDNGYYCCGRNSQPRKDNDLMNYEQNNTSSNQGHEY
jgi:hypothetical protein